MRQAAQKFRQVLADAAATESEKRSADVELEKPCCGQPAKRLPPAKPCRTSSSCSTISSSSPGSATMVARNSSVT